jgi:hypothetical protein
MIAIRAPDESFSKCTTGSVSHSPEVRSCARSPSRVNSLSMYCRVNRSWYPRSLRRSKKRQREICTYGPPGAICRAFAR